MILIFGGAYQGKLDYALKRFNFTLEDVYKCSDENACMPEKKKVIYEIDKWILALVKADIDATEPVRRFIDCSADEVVICNDISCGIVPLDPVMRKWREAVGRSLAALSHKSSEVVRLFCGIPARIKSTTPP
jgi:adenosyl cobinamide kinase/adenosyl cobinamide phosphate guanylyltransferase